MEQEHAREQARAALKYIATGLAAFQSEDECTLIEFDGESLKWQLHERLTDVLEISVRSDWHSPGVEEDPNEYKILLSTGGPAIRIVGDLDRYGEPSTAKLQYQDWFTPWTSYETTSEEDKTLLDYARLFWFGE